MTREGVAAAAAGAGGDVFGSYAYLQRMPEGTRYPYLHMLVESELDCAFADGQADGYAKGHAAGFRDGYATGLLTPDPPPVGSPAYRALERDTVREALAPAADSLARAVQAHLRDLEQKEARDRARAADTLPSVIYVPPGEPIPDQAVHQNADYGVPENGQKGTP